MKGYKAFDKGLVCRGKQYAENTVFEEDEAVICEKGMHFCAEPMDVLSFYPPESEFAEVEAPDEAVTNDNRKYVTKKLKVGSKMSLKELISAQVKIDLQKAKEEGNGSYAQGNYGHAAAQGNYGHAAAQGCEGHAAAQGDYGHAAAQGDWGRAAAQGNYGHAAAQGCEGHAAAQGDWGRAAAQGYRGHAAAQGDEGHAAAQGNYGHAAAQGCEGHAAAQGDYGHAAAQGCEGHAAAQGNYGRAVAQGDKGHAAAQGECGRAAVGGKDAIAAAFGIDGKVKACLGSWIMLAEWVLMGDGWHIKTVKTAKIDGEELKADTWYMLKNGEFEEVKE